MADALIMSRDSALRQRIQSVAGEDRILWVEDPSAIEELADPAGVQLALIDVAVASGTDIADLVQQCRRHARSVVAFLGSFGGELAIRAHLAGADRVIPAGEILHELKAVARGGPAS